MARIDCLTALKVIRIKEPGMYLDGRGRRAMLSNMHY
jgi:hypothetical protein